MKDSRTAKLELKNRKEQIRAKYRGAFVIPVNEQDDIFDDCKPRWVAIYPNITTGDTQQITSFELQKSYYEALLNNEPKTSDAVEG